MCLANRTEDPVSLASGIAQAAEAKHHQDPVYLSPLLGNTFLCVSFIPGQALFYCSKDGCQKFWAYIFFLSAKNNSFYPTVS